MLTLEAILKAMKKRFTHISFVFLLLLALFWQSFVLEQAVARGVAYTIDQTVWKKAQTIYLNVLPKAEIKYGKSSATYADFLTNLAIIDVIIGNKNALPLLIQAQAIRTKLGDTEKRKVLELQIMQADYLRESNRLEEAAKLYESCIERVALSKNLKPGDYDATIDDLLNKYVICDGTYSKSSKDGTWKFGKANINLPHRMSRCSLGSSWHNKMVPLDKGYLLGADGNAVTTDDLHSPKPWVPGKF